MRRRTEHALRRPLAFGRAAVVPGDFPLPALNLRNEENLRARRHRLEIAGLVQLAVDRDRGFLLQVLPQPRIQLIHRLQHTAEVLRFHLELPHTTGVAAREARGEHDPGYHISQPTTQPAAVAATSAAPSSACRSPSQWRSRWRPSADRY